MDPNLFLNLAVSLAKQGGPAECRSAVSRAYYAAHHAGVRFLKEVGLKPVSNSTSHAAVFNALLNGGDDEIKQAGSELSTLHGRRNRADYDLLDAAMEDQKLAESLVQVTWDIITVLQNCRQDLARLQGVRARFKNG